MRELLASLLASAIAWTLAMSVAAFASLCISRLAGQRRPGLACGLSAAIFILCALLTVAGALSARGACCRAILRSILPSASSMAQAQVGLPVGAGPAFSHAAGEGKAAAQAIVRPSTLPRSEDVVPVASILVTALCCLWSAGLLAGLASLCFGSASLRRLVASCAPCTDRAVLGLAGKLAASNGLTCRPAILVSSRGEGPFACGVFLPQVILPASILGEGRRHVDVVLSHEFSHIRRRDGLVLALLRTLILPAWLSPLPWFALRDFRKLREAANDEAVLRSGTDAVSYANGLLAVAKIQREARFGIAAMASPKGLEMRIKNILDWKGTEGPSLGRLRMGAIPLILSIAFAAVSFIGAASASDLPTPASSGPSTSESTRLAFVSPIATAVHISQGFGERNNPFTSRPYTHEGWDISDFKVGSAVRAVAPGFVVDAGFDKDRGNYLVIEHDGGLRTRYRHLAKPSPLASGRHVGEGESLGTVGNTGTGPHLDLAVLAKGADGKYAPVDPAPYFAVRAPGLVREAMKEAVTANDLAGLRSLLALGVDLDATTSDGGPVLASVFMMGNCDAARLLVAAGADPLARDSAGLTMRSRAEDSGNKALIAILGGTTR